MTTKQSTQFEREHHAVSRTLEYFSEDELQMQMGHKKEQWPLVLVKELIDNALDATEPLRPPIVRVSASENRLEVEDNGPGIPADVIERSLDYLVRVSDKALYVSPSRGQLGNALKCVWTAPFVAAGEGSGVTVESQGIRHEIRVSVNRLLNVPEIDHQTSESAVTEGAIVRINWEGVGAIAGYGGQFESGQIYNDSLRELIFRFALFNPHASLRYVKEVECSRDSEGSDDDSEGSDDDSEIFKMNIFAEVFGTVRNSSASHYIDTDNGTYEWLATDETWTRWHARRAPSVHWFDGEQFRNLVAATAVREPEKTVREFMLNFDGMKATAKQRKVGEESGLSGAPLKDLIVGNELDEGRTFLLFTCLRGATKPILSKSLGAIGGEHLETRLAEFIQGDEEEDEEAAQPMRYTQTFNGNTDVKNGEAPWSQEFAFGVRRDMKGRRIVINGLNGSPTLKNPAPAILSFIHESADSLDAVLFVVHISNPNLAFAEHGKGSLILDKGVAS